MEHGHGVSTSLLLREMKPTLTSTQSERTYSARPYFHRSVFEDVRCEYRYLWLTRHNTTDLGPKVRTMHEGPIGASGQCSLS